jgi:N-acetylmuramoyl-L-alanine amidase
VRTAPPPPPQVQDFTKHWEAAPAPAPPLPEPEPLVEPPPPKPAALPSQPEPVEYLESWASLSHWTQAQGLGPLERVSLSPQPISSSATNGFKWQNLDLKGLNVIEPFPTFSLKTREGELILQSGTPQAYWNGVTFDFGFAPKLVQGELLVRDLDLENTIKPLLAGPGSPVGAKPKTIVIDPGHGGRDTGCVSVRNHNLEKGLTLDWAERLATLLRRCGYRVVLTRTNDMALSAAQRAQVAEDCHADLFVSLHFDYSEANADLSGVQAWSLAPVGVPTSRRQPPAENPWEALPNNRYDAESLRYAFRCQQALVASLGALDNGVHRVRYRGILADQERPAVLILGGYLSNPQEAEWIGNPAYRQRLAEALARGLE